MADWKDVTHARQEADGFARRTRGYDLHTNDPGICDALEALRLEVRALSVLIDQTLAVRSAVVARV